ncbi:MAG: hypothetical protein GF317_13200 [Candidatus Lokiarchaeota archaeon]|nr:hypothetical protein [Candidatus Lokiarchaeota archaeon]MBD3200593.1 hypothetical protein [Candidatus Lokiarchaeota archaeon]
MAMKDNIATVSFLIIYLVIIWVFIIKILIENRKVIKEKGQVWNFLFIGYIFLAFGDIFHLGFRIYMFFANVPLDSDLAGNLFGYGYIITSITMTYLYIELFRAWRKIYGDHYSTSNKNFLYELIIDVAFIFRIVLLLNPYNHWFDYDPVWEFGFDFRILSALPLYLIGIITVGLLFKDSRAEMQKSTGINPDWNKANNKVSIWLIVSYAFYSITTFLVIYIPIAGMAMVPKTIAYLVALYYHYKYILKNKDNSIEKGDKN